MALDNIFSCLVCCEIERVQFIVLDIVEANGAKAWITPLVLLDVLIGKDST